MTRDRKLSIRKTPDVGPSEIIEIVYSTNFPSDEELARLSDFPGPVYVLDDAVAFVEPDAETTELPLVPMTVLPEPFEKRFPLMAGLSFGLPDFETFLAVARRGRLFVDELPLLFAGDQLFVRREVRGPVRKWLVAFLIRVATFTRKDKRPTVFNHVATVIRALREFEVVLLLAGSHPLSDAMSEEREFAEGPIVDYLICEALGEGGVQLRRLVGSYGDEELYSIAIARHWLATQEHRAKIVDAELSLLGRPYGYAKIGAHVADYALTRVWNLAGGPGDVYAFRWLCRMERYPMCSWKSLYSYRKAGLPFSTALSTGSPDDLADECLRKTPTIWTWPFISPTIRDELLAPGTGDDEGRTN